MSSLLVHVHTHPRGAWEVALPDPPDRVSCGTLEDAKRVAYLYAAHRGPAEVIVHDAYHRVLDFALIEGPDARG